MALHQLHPVAWSLTADATKTIVHAFVACRLDYCNSLLHGSTNSLFRRLQSIQNAAAHLITGTRRRDHISPVLMDLHWLPVRRRVDYKLALLVYKSLNGLAPPSLADDCIQASSDKFCRRLRSADVDTCIVPRTRTSFGDRSFSAAGPRIWNSLPPDLRWPDIELGEFRRLLKTFLFVLAQLRRRRTSDFVIMAQGTSCSYYYYYYYLCQGHWCHKIVTIKQMSGNTSSYAQYGGAPT